MNHIKKPVNIFHPGFGSFSHDTDIDITEKRCVNIECPYYYHRGCACQYNDPLKAIYPYG